MLSRAKNEIATPHCNNHVIVNRGLFFSKTLDRDRFRKTIIR